jgi:hypothetical protein
VAGTLGPQSEAELLTHLPPSNRPGVLRREILPPGERVLYETRPSMLALYWGRLIFLGFWILFFGGLGATAPPDVLPGVAIFLTPAVLWIVVIYLQWSHTVYALTDQRVIRISGMTGSEFLDASYPQIHNLTSEGGGIRFDTTPAPSFGGFQAPAKTRVIRWSGLSDTARVYTFVQEAFAFEIDRSRQAAATHEVLQKAVAASIPCAYCGSPIDLATLDPANPRCPICSAPVTLPSA